MDEFKEKIGNYWNGNPCGRKFVASEIGSRDYFSELTKTRYDLEPHIYEFLSGIDFKGKKVLEVGFGQGTDAAFMAEHGADYYGVDLSNEHLSISKKRFQLFGLKGNFRIADAENLPFDDNSFDMVYSNGVIHHTPDTQKTVDEIYRVLRPGGKAVVMVYHKNSYNYYINIMFLRRIGILMLSLPYATKILSRVLGEAEEVLIGHRNNLRKNGLKYLSAENFLSQNTDGPGNPLSKAYTKTQLKHMFAKFSKKKTEVRYLNKRWIPLIGRFLPKRVENALAKLWGWHLFIFAEK